MSILNQEKTGGLRHALSGLKTLTAMQLKEKIEAELHPKKVFVSDVFWASGTNIGPGMVGAYFLGEPVSQDGEAEKEMMNRALAANS